MSVQIIKRTAFSPITEREFVRYNDLNCWPDDGNTNSPIGYVLGQVENEVSIAVPGQHGSVIEQGSCGSCQWFIYSDGTLEIGKGNLDNLSIPDRWRDSNITNLEIYCDIVYRNCFIGNTNIESITIYSTVKIIGQRAFDGCTGLNIVTIESGLTKIDIYAFNNCVEITLIKIPSSVSYVGSHAFQNWDGSQTIQIDNTEEYVAEKWLDTWNSECNAIIIYSE